MSEEYIAHKINVPQIGEIEIKLTKDQLLKFLKKGKEEVIKEVNEKQLNKYIYRDPDPVLKDIPDGMVGNDTDWNELFPSFSEEDINNTIAESESYTRKNLNNLKSLLQIGLMEYLRNTDIYTFFNDDDLNRLFNEED